MGDADDIRIAVIGLGYVGLPTALGLADLGWPVTGVESDAGKARRIANGEAPFYEPELAERLRCGLDSGKFAVAADADAALQAATVIVICVGTPRREDGGADLTQIDLAGQAIARNLNGRKLIVQKSTAPVGTADRLREGARFAAAQRCGEPDFDVAVNPEFMTEGAAFRSFYNPDRIVIGADSERAAALLSEMHRPLFERTGRAPEETLMVTSARTAEIIKHASNAFLAAKISFINMVADLCEASGADVAEVARAVGMDPRIAPAFLRAGVGFGGSCLPKDLSAFIRVGEENGADFSLLREVERVNSRRPARFVERLTNALGGIEGKTVAVWGLAFKPDSDDARDAPSIPIARALIAGGARLRLHDPQAMSEFEGVFPPNPPSLVYADSPESAAEGADAVVILTEWDAYRGVDLPGLRPRMANPLILDGRNCLDPAVVRRAGFDYAGVGRR